MSKKDITSSDIKRLMLQSYRRYRDGEISEAKAKNENTLLINIFKAVEATETQERLNDLEQTLSGLRDNSVKRYTDSGNAAQETDAKVKRILKAFKEKREEDKKEGSEESSTDVDNNGSHEEE